MGLDYVGNWQPFSGMVLESSYTFKNYITDEWGLSAEAGYDESGAPLKPIYLFIMNEEGAAIAAVLIKRAE